MAHIPPLLVPLALMATLVSCWLVPRVITLALAMLVIGFGLIFDGIDLIALPFLLILGFSGWWWAQKERGLWRWFAGLIFTLTSIALFHHWLPGFNNVPVIDHLVLKADSAPFTLYYNLDKPWVGLVLLLTSVPLLSSGTQWQKVFRRALWPTGLMLPVVFALGLIAGFVRWQPAWPNMALLFLLNNLLFTALTEEVFFRGFIQKSLEKRWQRYSWGKFGALGLAAILFGLDHYSGGPVYMALAAIAGCFYGWSYQRTGSIEMAILTHWLLNLCHFFFFSYPMAV